MPWMRCCVLPPLVMIRIRMKKEKQYAGIVGARFSLLLHTAVPVLVLSLRKVSRYMPRWQWPLVICVFCPERPKVSDRRGPAGRRGVRLL